VDLSKFPRLVAEHKLATILAVGIIARIVLMPISAHPFDMYIWYNISENILKNGPFVLQTFPPLWSHYMMIPVAYTYGWLSGVFSSGAIPMSSLPSTLNFYPASNIQYVPGMLFNFIVKIPFLISDIAIAFLLYKIVGELTGNKRHAEKAAILWFLNPFAIWISAGWGMWDTLPALFSLAAFFFLLKKKIGLSAVCLSLGVALKLYPALFLAPIAIYLLKTSPAEIKLKNSLRFCALFIVTTLLLFLPYIGMVTNFFNGYFMPNPSSSTLADPVVYPLGFGLTYWSLFLLNRLLHLSITAGFVSFASIASILFVVSTVVFTYWKTYKFSIRKPSFDLALFMLLPVIALFLSFRFICEQWFVWAIPFLIILYAGGRIKGAIYWGASAVSLIYALLNLPLPFFFLPLAPLYQNTLLSLLNVYWAFEPFRILSLAVLGCIFSLLMVLIVVNLRKVRISERLESIDN